ncbi:MAG: hypothetical protein HYS12_18190 [Planctomycetes bacterium]|nr:hypothetical protein [Planctomycetota bacterium]
MNDLPLLEHALCEVRDGTFRLLARSPGFLDEWQAQTERLCAGFGERPEGLACPGSVFARPIGKSHVAVVRAADQGQDREGRPGPLGFHIVVLPADLYGHLGGDPFYLAERMPSPWGSRDVLTPLNCPEPAAERRTVAEVRKVIDVPNSATLLGGTQALLDGGKVVFERSAPDESVLRSLWALLPTATRKELWPASFAFGNALGFDALVVPRLDPGMFATYILEEKAGDYPEGHYELALQTAAEAGNQEELDALFSRRSYKETRKLALFLLAIVFFLPLIFALLKDKEGDKEPERRSPSDSAFEPPSVEKFAPLSAEQTRVLATRLRQLSTRLKVPERPAVPGAVLAFGGAVGPIPDPLRAAAVLSVDRHDVPTELLHAIDVHLGTPDPKRAGRDLWHLGPASRQLRGLLYKHGIERYKNSDLRPEEMVDLLERKLNQGGSP